MVIKSASLDIVCGITSRLPETGQPEIAFAGRSNVGKSSLINALLNRKKLARTSSEPGKTQTINFYHVNEELYLVDLPGYGYAKTSKQTREKWAGMIEKYFSTSKGLKLIIILVDIRHDPTVLDVQMYKMAAESGFEPLVVATKLDKIKKSQLSKQISVIKKTLDMQEGMVIPFSAETKQGREEIWEYIESLLPGEKAVPKEPYEG